MSILRALAPQLFEAKQIDRIEKFAKKNGLDSDEQLKIALESARFNVKWADKNVPNIIDAIQAV